MDTMCKFKTISGDCDCDCDCSPPSGFLPYPSPIFYSDAESSREIDRLRTYSTFHPDFMSPRVARVASSLPFPRQPVLSVPATDQSSVNIQQPPPDVVDSLFDPLGFSLDPALLENPSNIPTFGFPLLDDINPHPASGTSPVKMSSQAWTPISESKEISVPLLPPPNQVKSRRSPSGGVVRHQPRIAHERRVRRVYDRPGKKPAAEYEPDPVKLQASCRLRGGTDFARQWILTVFKDGVTLKALVRRLKLTEIERMNFPGGFEPCLAYDGFLQKAEDGFECCLCTGGKGVWWKNKKEAVRHFRKFHFGLADQCYTCHKCIYSTGEMNSHRCVRVPLQNSATPASGTGPGFNAGAHLYSTPN